MSRIAGVFALAVAISQSAEPGVTHRSPRLASVFPQGAEPGSVLRADALGQHLDRAARVEFLEPGIQGRVLDGRHTALSLELQINDDAEIGPHYFRIVSPRGASNLVLFRVGDQQHDHEIEPNGVIDQAQSLKTPLTLNGRLSTAKDIDIFRIRARAGEHLIFDLRAARNGSALDASMILLDAEGRKLDHVEDLFIWDPFFSHAFESEGERFLVLQPTRGRTGPTHGYQLDIRRAPHLDGLAPLALAAGSTSTVTVLGAGLDQTGLEPAFSSEGITGEVVRARHDGIDLQVSAGETAAPGRHSLTILTPEGRSNPVPFWVHQLPLHQFGEKLSIPSAVLGSARYDQPDRFSFDARAGESVVFEIKAMRLGSPTDMTMRIVQAVPSASDRHCCPEIARNDDGNFPGVRFNKDPKIEHTFKETGRYELQVRNLWRVQASTHPYYLEVRRPRPRIELTLDSDTAFAYPESDGSVGVTIHRIEGHEEAVELSILGLPDGTHSPAEVIPPVAKSMPAKDRASQKAKLRFRAEDLPGGFGTVKIVARNEGVVAWRTVRISSGGGEGATEARVNDIALAVAEPVRFNLEAQLRTVVIVRGTRAQIPVEIRRKPAMIDPIRFDIENLPAGISFDPVSAEPDRDTITMTVSAGDDAIPGSYPGVAVLGTDLSGTTEQAPTITLVVN